MGKRELGKMVNVFQADYARLSAECLQRNDRFFQNGIFDVWTDTEDSYFFHCWPYTKSRQINTAMLTNATFVLVYSEVLLDVNFTFKVLNEKWSQISLDQCEGMLGWRQAVQIRASLCMCHALTNATSDTPNNLPG